MLRSAIGSRRACPASTRGGTSDAPTSALRERHPRVVVDADDLAGRLHPRPDRRVDAAQLGGRERRRLDRDERRRLEQAVRPAQRLRSVSPSAIRTASSTIGTPVTLLMNGTVREARG